LLITKGIVAKANIMAEIIITIGAPNIIAVKPPITGATTVVILSNIYESPNSLPLVLVFFTFEKSTRNS